MQIQNPGLANQRENAAFNFAEFQPRRAYHLSSADY